MIHSKTHSSDAGAIMKRAFDERVPVPSFNIPYLPMTMPIIEAVRDEDSFAFISVARLEWEKFESKSPEAVAAEYARYADPGFVRLHLDHVPVIDEDDLSVDYVAIIRGAIAAGYESVMVDGSRLPLEENIAATRAIVELAHAAGLPVEAELGAVMGHEEGPPLPYEEILRTRRGFTDVAEAERFVLRSGCDWLSVAIGNVHGAVSRSLRDAKKVAARLDLEHLANLAKATGIPLVLHGGSGVPAEYLREACRLGMVKVNVGTQVRQVYEQRLRATGDIEQARKGVYEETRHLLRDWLGATGTRLRLFPDARGA